MRPVFEVMARDDGPGFALSGELDLSAVAVLNEALLTVDGREDVALDLSGLTFIDSSGIRAILVFAQSLDGGRRVLLVDPSPTITRSLEIIGMDKHPQIEVVG